MFGLLEARAQKVLVYVCLVCIFDVCSLELIGGLLDLWSPDKQSSETMKLSQSHLVTTNPTFTAHVFMNGSSLV